LNREAFYSALKPELVSFWRQDQVDGLERFLDHFETVDALLINQAAYVLATAWHETAATMQPITEYGSMEYIERLYDPIKAISAARRQRARQMGNVNEGDGWRYRGRGYVQLTWRNNYRKMGERLGIPLEDQPELANDPLIAIQILWVGMQEGLFTGQRLSQHINAHQSGYIAARRVVNGLDQARLIAGYAVLFERALREAV
jgi:predicted chitinase